MSAMTFDTLKFVESLENAGMERPQAAAIAGAVRDAQQATDVATKGDLRELELRVRGEMAEIRGEQTLQRWMLGFVLAGIISLVVKTFFG